MLQFVPPETRKERETELLRNKNSVVKGRMTGNVFVITILSLNKHNDFNPLKKKILMNNISVFSLYRAASTLRLSRKNQSFAAV